MPGGSGSRIMGDISAEPSMEEILSSIKRIIAEEETPAGRKRVSARPVGPGPSVPTAAPAAQPAPAADLDDEVLELSDPMPARAEAPVFENLSVPEPLHRPDPIVSPAAADATRGALESLSRLMVKPEANSDGTLEGLVRDMLRPMLREWLDANLPDMVESMVSREIARISGQTR